MHLAALAGPVPKAGVVVVALLAATALLARAPRARAAAIIGCILLSPALLLAEVWHSPHVRAIHHHPLLALVVGALALGVVGVVARVIALRPWSLGLLAVLALPFRVPVSAGGSTA